MEFMLKFLKNIFSDSSNIVTCISVIVSGLLSLLISAFFHYEGHRDNLKISVIHPIVKILKESCSKQNFNKLEEISKEYSTRYMSKKELTTLYSLVDIYKKISSYNEDNVNADILYSYFLYTLQKNNIDMKIEPIIFDGETVEYGYPIELSHLSIELREVVKYGKPYIDPEGCRDSVISLYLCYSEYYHITDDIDYFEDYSLEEVLKISKIKKEWEDNFEEFQNIKKDFLKLQIANK